MNSSIRHCSQGKREAGGEETVDMMSRIEQLISEIEEYIDSCKFQALSNSKIIVNKEELEELLVELRLRIPDEIKKYQKIISSRKPF